MGKAKYINYTSDSCRLQHCELLGSVAGTNAFNINVNTGTFQVNPGIQSSFPWLSCQAAAWEKYKFHSLTFVYHTKCPTTTAGNIIMAMDYDAGDVAPSTEQQMTSFYGAVESAPWREIRYKCDMTRMKDSRYIRVSAVTGQDIKTFDQGVLYVGTVDGTDGAGWGKLWVEYDVELQIPAQCPAAGIGVYYANNITTAALFPVINNAAINSKNYNISINGDPTTANRLLIDGLVVGKIYSLDFEVVGTTISNGSIITNENEFGLLVINPAATSAVAVVNFLATTRRAIVDMTLVAVTVVKLAMNVKQVIDQLFLANP